jgi:hypothetical protein
VFNNLDDFESWFDFSGMVSSNNDNSENVGKEIMEQARLRSLRCLCVNLFLKQLPCCKPQSCRCS